MKFLLSILLTVPAGLLQAGEKPIPTWTDLVREIRENNPELQAARANWRALQQRVPQAAAWEDPVAGVDVERSGTTNPGKYSDTEWMLSQKIPLSGRNRVAARGAAAEAESKRHAIQMQENQLLLEAAEAWFTLYAAERWSDALQQKEAILKVASRAAESRFSTGQQTAPENLAILSSAASVEAENAVWTTRAEEQRIRLNQLRNRPLDSPITIPGQVDLIPLTLSNVEIASAAAMHPAVHGATSMIDAARQRLVSARRAWIPDPELRIEARHFEDSGQAFTEYDTGIFFSMPWPNQKKYRAAISEAAAELEKARAEAAAASLQINAGLQARVARIRARLRRYTILRDRLIPLSQTALASAEASYAAGRISLAEALEPRLQTIELRAQLAEALADYQTSVRQFQIEANLP